MSGVNFKTHPGFTFKDRFRSGRVRKNTGSQADGNSRRLADLEQSLLDRLPAIPGRLDSSHLRRQHEYIAPLGYQ